MRFLVDAQLPGRLTAWLRARGHDATHTRDLALGNRTPDGAITQIADAEDRAVRFNPCPRPNRPGLRY